LDHQAVEKSEQMNFWQLVAGILLLGNVQFDTSKADAASVLPNAAKYLKDCEAVLGLNPNTIGKALTKKKIKAGSDFVEQDLTIEKANDGRDALSKAIYSRLFDYLIAKINAALVAGGEQINSADQVKRRRRERGRRVLRTCVACLLAAAAAADRHFASLSLSLSACALSLSLSLSVSSV